MSASPSKSFLDDIPPELRMEVYRYACAHRPWLFLRIYDTYVIDGMPAANHSATKSNGGVASLLRSCREIHDEATRELLDLTEVKVTIDGLKEEVSIDAAASLGTVEEITFWKSLRKVQLDVAMRREGNRGFAADSLLSRIRRFVDALKNGQHLKEIQIRLSWPDGTSVPACIEDIVEALGALKSWAIVTVDGDMEDEEKMELEERLEQQIRRG